jgi:hypothetical protein
VANMCCELATKLLFLILEQRISIYVRSNVALAFPHREGSFLNNKFSNPASRSAKMPAAFAMG